MEEILEIRDGCSTPIQLLKSTAFAKYLDIYKKQFIKELKNRENTDLKEDVLHKIKYIKNIDSNTYIEILRLFLIKIYSHGELLIICFVPLVRSIFTKIERNKIPTFNML